MTLAGRIIRKYKQVRLDQSINSAHGDYFAQMPGQEARFANIISLYDVEYKKRMQAYKLASLERVLEEHKPKSILELGSGSSTVVFAEYARKNNARLLSIEENEGWAEKFKKNVGGDDKIQIRICNRVTLKDKTPPEIRYDLPADEQFDCIFIDGPPLEFDGVKRKDSVNSNVFDFKDTKLIIVDGRYATAKEIAKRWSSEYNVFMSDLIAEKPVGKNYNYFSLFTKR